MTHPKILALWVDPNSKNFGVRALAEGLRSCLPSAVELDFASHERTVDGVPLSVRELTKASVLPRSRFREALSKYSLVVDVGEGDSFATIYGTKRFVQFAASKQAVTRAGVPLVLAPQTLGPWQGATGRLVARRVMRRADQVWARDTASLERAGAVGCRVSAATDLVFAIPQGVATKKASKVMVNASGLLWQPNNHVDHVLYRELISQLIRQLRKSGAQVELLPHVIAPGSTDDDAGLAAFLAEEFSLTVSQSDDLEAMRESIASADLVVGSRMHACLNALSQGVPCIPMAYSDKFESLFADLEYPHSVDLRSPDAVGSLAAKVVSARELAAPAQSAQAHGRARVATFSAALGDLVAQVADV
jgi:colanic acid/amylovoran biosynthesis protein